MFIFSYFSHTYETELKYFPATAPPKPAKLDSGRFFLYNQY